MICFGIDPGQLCGVAHQTDDGERGSAVVELVQLGEYLNGFKTDRVVVYIEKAVGNWQRFRSHQGNANAVIRAFKKHWPRHNTIHTFEPRTWQASVISNAPGQTTKQRSLWVANQDPKLDHEITDDNESDARNILTHGLAVAPPTQKKGCDNATWSSERKGDCHERQTGPGPGQDAQKRGYPLSDRGR